MSTGAGVRGGRLARLTDFAASAQGVVAALLLYGVCHALITLATGPTLALDDAKLNVLTQSLRSGYLPENPPLFEWVLIGIQRATGATLAGFVVAKYSWLTLAGLFTYLAAKEATGERRFAAAAVGSLLLVYQIGWNYHQAFTHTTALLCATAFFWWRLLRLVAERNVANYVWLGAALGIGALAKYSFIAAALIALCATLRPESRAVIADRRMSVAIITAMLICAPHGLWLIGENADVAASAARRLADPATPYWVRVLRGAPQALWAEASFFLPLAPIVVGIFGGDILRAPAPVSGGAGVARDSVILGAGGLVAAVFVIGMGAMQERYVIAFLYPAIIYLAAVLKAAGQGPRLGRFGLAAMTVCLVVVGLRAVEALVAGPPFCRNCRQAVDFAPLATAIRDAGFERGALVGFEDQTAGNLRRLFPDARVLSAHMPFYTPSGGTPDEPCWFVWSDDLGPPPPAHLIEAIDETSVFSVVAQPLRGARPAVRWSVAPMNHRPDYVLELCRPSVSG